MVSIASIVSIVVGIVISFVLPVGLAVLVISKSRVEVKPIAVGAIAFVVFDLLLREGLLSLIKNTDFFTTLLTNPILMLVVYGILGAIFIEIGKWVAIKFGLKTFDSFSSVIGFAIGFATIQSVWRYALTFIDHLVKAISINMGKQVITQSVADSTTILTEIPYYSFLLTAFQSLLIIVISMGLCVMVYNSVKKKKPSILFYAVMIQFFVSGGAALFIYMDMFYTELYLLMWAIVTSNYVYKYYNEEIKNSKKLGGHRGPKKRRL